MSSIDLAPAPDGAPLPAFSQAMAYCMRVMRPGPAKANVAHTLAALDHGGFLRAPTPRSDVVDQALAGGEQTVPPETQRAALSHCARWLDYSFDLASPETVIEILEMGGFLRDPASQPTGVTECQTVISLLVAKVDALEKALRLQADAQLSAPHVWRDDAGAEQLTELSAGAVVAMRVYQLEALGLASRPEVPADMPSDARSVQYDQITFF